ncbi:hypothetical protein BC829DRAFT_433984 [Chytridium lagenaria]|nr:hypothetical protein BC829DRAFT_433984 [Chytridium lagenaria]
MESKPSKGPDTPEEHGGGSDNNSPNVSGGTTSASEKKKRGKRYNLKLSTLVFVDLKNTAYVFQEPYHDYLNALLDQLPPKDSATSTALSSRLVSSLHTAPKGTDWTVWISLESRSRFLDKKAIYAPGATHSEFVEFLLRNREETRRGELSPGVEAAAELWGL